MKRANAIAAARSEIRANIREVLNTQQLKLKLADGLAQEMDALLEHIDHPINKLFALARLDKADPDHWRVLLFIMAEEIFHSNPVGRPPTTVSNHIKHWELLFFLNAVHLMGKEDGMSLGIADAVNNLPLTFSLLGMHSETEQMARRYGGVKKTTLARYIQEALTDGEKRIRSRSGNLDPMLAEVIEEALDNFRPGWRNATGNQE